MYPAAETCSSTAAGSRPMYEGGDTMVRAHTQVTAIGVSIELVHRAKCR